MQSEIKVGQRFKFNLVSDSPSQEREAVVITFYITAHCDARPEAWSHKRSDQRFASRALRCFLPLDRAGS